MKRIYKSETCLEVIAIVKRSESFHEKREAMGALTISLVLSYLNSKNATKFTPITEY